MKRKLKSDRGFTLAELLIVVAIIGVLVAIAIPIFTSQLERSREAVDLSDVRSAYAEVMMAAITGGYQCYVYKNRIRKYIKDNGDYYIKVTPLKQQKKRLANSIANYYWRSIIECRRNVLEGNSWTKWVLRNHISCTY